MRRKSSIDADYFEGLYRDKGDPWSFETSPYEAAKYARTLEVMPNRHIASLLEIGCANGVLTAKLGGRCDDLLAVDVSETALAAARARCADQPHIRFEKRQLPHDAPEGCFDLILLSEVVYYFDPADVARLAAYVIRALRSGGDLLLVHWLGETDYPLSGDEAVLTLGDALGATVEEVVTERHDQYRIDLWHRN
jgi:cyclopropane fatty-acyl-phospholipid synthase-like methyltransferase